MKSEEGDTSTEAGAEVPTIDEDEANDGDAAAEGDDEA